MESEHKHAQSNQDFEDLVKDLVQLGNEEDLRKRWSEHIKPPKPKFNRFLYLLIIAMVLAIGFFALRGRFSPRLFEIGKKNLIAAEAGIMQDISFRNIEGENTKVHQARAAMENDQFREAIQLYNGFSGELAVPDRLLLALAYHYSGDTEASSFTFNDIINDKNIYYDEAQWLLINSYIASENYEISLEILSRFVSATNYKEDAANELLIKLKRRQ